MARVLGRLEVGIECTNCDSTIGHPVDKNLNRCVNCGGYASTKEIDYTISP